MRKPAWQKKACLKVGPQERRNRGADDRVRGAWSCTRDQGGCMGHAVMEELSRNNFAEDAEDAIRARDAIIWQEQRVELLLQR